MNAQTFTWRDLTPLIAPSSVAIVGASQRGADANLAREPRGNRVIRNLRNFGFTGRIVTVNPKYTEIMGYPCYPDVASIPEPVDCIVSAVPNRHVPDLLESAANAGVRAAVVFAAGFGEIGGEGKVRQARLEALSKERGFLICGPNCYGVLNVHGKAPLFASTIPPGFIAGSVALISQSGGLSTTIANALMLNRHVGLSHIISCGNQSGATIEEYMNYFVEDANTRVIAVFVEGFKQPERLLTVAGKAAAANKPLIILKGGRSDVSKRAAATHSGSLAGAAEVVDAAFRQGGIVSVRSINELIDSISVFSCDGFIDKYRGGRRIGVLSGSGGECTLVSDAASNVGVEVPELTEATKANLQEVGRRLRQHEQSARRHRRHVRRRQDLPAPAPRSGRRRQHRHRHDQSRSQRSATQRTQERQPFHRWRSKKPRPPAQKPIATFSSVVGGPVDPEILQPLRPAGVPIMEGAECATATIRNLADYYDFQKARLTGGGEVPRPAAHAKLPSGVLGAEAAFALFKEFNIPVAPTVLTRTADEAAAAADKMGYPVVLKVESAQITHKSDVGGVALRLTNADEVRTAFTQHSKHRQKPRAECEDRRRHRPAHGRRGRGDDPWHQARSALRPGGLVRLGRHPRRSS